MKLMEKYQFIFILPSEEVTVYGRKQIKKAYRNAGKEAVCIYQSPHLFTMPFDKETDKSTIVCVAFERRHFIDFSRWIERSRENGFKGRILLSVEPGTFDFGTISKFMTCGGSYIVNQNEWRLNPLKLLETEHCEAVTAWQQNYEVNQSVTMMNKDAVEYLYYELLQEEPISFDDLSYVYNGLDKGNRGELLRLMKGKIRHFGAKLFKQKDSGIFDKGIIGVWSNSKFSSELCIQLSEQRGLKVLLIDLDRLNPTLDFYCPYKIESESKIPKDLSGIQYLYSQNNITFEALEKLCYRPRGSSDLKVLYGCSNLKKFEYFTNEALLETLACFKRNYDVVVLNMNEFIYDAYTCLGIIKADCVLIPFDGLLPSLRHYQRSLDLLCLKQKISKDKFHYIFFECSEYFPGEIQLLSEMIHQPILGWISRCKKRDSHRNLKCSYGQKMSKHIVAEYEMLFCSLLREEL